MEEFLQVGIISSTHGIKGEVKVFPTTDDASRFKELKTVWIDLPHEKKELSIEQIKFFKQFVILKFKGLDSIDDSIKYKGKSLFVSREQAVKLEEDEYFIGDLIGVIVTDDENETVGEITDILQTGANDVYVVKGNEGKEYYIPAIKECILDVNPEKKTMKIHFLPGLKEL
ncbi:MAG: ribosome maturation factor RimM [Lachnospiraceae bacterium]